MLFPEGLEGLLGDFPFRLPGAIRLVFVGEEEQKEQKEQKGRQQDGEEQEQ